LWWFSAFGLNCVSNRVHLFDVECDALSAYADLSQSRSDFGVETIAIHAEKIGGIAKPNEPRWDVSFRFHRFSFGARSRQKIELR
jgi:hypothetical protein